MFHYTYKVSFIDSGCYYIGKHSTLCLSDNYTGSGTTLKEMQNQNLPFIFEIISYYDTEDDAYKAEGELVGDKWHTDELCINRICGGKGGFRAGLPRPKEWNEKIGNANRKPKSAKGIAANIASSKIAAAIRTGQKDSEETKAKRNASVSKATAGVPKPSHRKHYEIDGVLYIGYEDVQNRLGISPYKLRIRIADDDNYPTWKQIKKT